MRTISKQKLLGDKDNLEILRFVYFVDPESLKNQFLDIGVIIQSENDLAKFTQGITPFGTRHNINVNNFLNNVTFDHDLLKHANIQFV